MRMEISFQHYNMRSHPPMIQKTNEIKLCISSTFTIWMTLPIEAWKYFGWVDTFRSLWVIICFARSVLRVKTTSRKLSINKNSIPSNFHLARMPPRPPLVGKCLAKMQLAAKLTGTRPDPDMIHHIIWARPG